MTKHYKLPASAYAQIWKASAKADSVLRLARPVGFGQVRWMRGEKMGGVVCTVPGDDGLAALAEAQTLLAELRRLGNNGGSRLNVR